MPPSTFRIRRATLDDLGALQVLWRAMHFSDEQSLEKRLTDFQVAEDAQQKIVGALAIRIEGRNAILHSEAFENFGVADEVRPLFWQRVEALTTNHGVARLWTQERSPFWSRNGFQAATKETLAKLPDEWSRMEGQWLTLQLKDEQVLQSLDKEVSMIMMTERRRTMGSMETTKTLKIVVSLIGFLLAALIFGAAAYLWLNRANIGVPR
jgi:N-acetylglutamate synthase-like GNAT family acetyltransferase